MDERHITAFLKKFTKTLLKKEETVSSVQNSIEKIVHISLSVKEFSIQNNILRLKARPHIKSEILIKKEKVIQELKKNEYTNKIVDIV